MARAHTFEILGALRYVHAPSTILHASHGFGALYSSLRSYVPSRRQDRDTHVQEVHPQCPRLPRQLRLIPGIHGQRIYPHDQETNPKET
ncbi:hypothetical protein CF319_g3314 [Tilletia indica]|nr:hypothetical protein CF319_g3314 [Tilletia indica]